MRRLIIVALGLTVCVMATTAYGVRRPWREGALKNPSYRRFLLPVVFLGYDPVLLLADDWQGFLRILSWSVVNDRQITSTLVLSHYPANVSDRLELSGVDA